MITMPMGVFALYTQSSDIHVSKPGRLDWAVRLRRLFLPFGTVQKRSTAYLAYRMASSGAK